MPLSNIMPSWCGEVVQTWHVGKGAPPEAFADSWWWLRNFGVAKIKGLDSQVIYENLVTTQGKAQGRHMIIELGNIHVKWKLLIEGTCMLLANGNVTVWIGTWFRVRRYITNKGETNYMGGIGVAKLKWRKMKTMKPIIARTDLGTSNKRWG
jgi:hypothetical protein